MLSCTSFFNIFVCAVSLSFSLVTFKYHVFALNSSDQPSSRTNSEDNICLDIFNVEQCKHINMIVKAVLSDGRLNYEKRLQTILSEERFYYEQKIDEEKSKLESILFEERFYCEQKIDEEKSKLEMEKVIMVDQVAKIKQDVNYLKKELKNTRRKLNRFLDSEKYRKEKKTQPINELEVTLSKGYNNYKREPSIHSHEANINNMTNVRICVHICIYNYIYIKII